MATLKQRVHLKNSSGTYDTVHYETEAGLVLYTNNNQSNVSEALDTLFTDKLAKYGYLSNTAKTTFYVHTTIKPTTSWSRFQGYLMGTGSSYGTGLIYFSIYANSTDISGRYSDPFSKISGITGIIDGDGYVVLKIELTVNAVQVWHVGVFSSGTNTNRIESVSATAPTEIAYSEALTRMYETLEDSGATAGSYGPSANASPAHSGTFSVPYITVDAKGRVTAASTKTITLPADNNTTYSNFVKSGSGAKAGLVPAPSTTAGTTKYLREDATWQVPPDTDTTYSAFVKSGSSAAAGLVPKPSTTAGTTKYLREDATWVVPPDNNTTYTFATGDSNGQIKVTPSGGTAANVSVKGLGTAAYTASTAYAAASHAHGDITNAGAIGSTSGYSVYTTTSGKLTAGSLATTDPDVSNATTIEAISEISQDAKGKITATKSYPSGLIVSITAGTAAAKTARCHGFTLKAKTLIPIVIANDNEVEGKITLNINGTGAKNVYIDGTVSSASNHTLPAGVYLAYYSGSYYYFRTDGKINTDITGNAATATTATTANALASTLTIAEGGTGATTALAAITALGGLSIASSGTSIPSTAAAPVDINTYVTAGTYYAASADIASTIVNTPWTNVLYKLFVIQAGNAKYFMQIAINGNNAIAFRGTKTATSSPPTWTAWRYTSNATTSLPGFMSAADKEKLNGIATGANNYTHPSYTAKSSGLYKVTVDATGHVSAATAVAKADITGLGIPAQDTTYSTFVKSGSSAAAGLVPKPSTTAGTTKYLREDATWVVPPDTVYTHPTTAGNKHIPSGGSSGQFLKYSAAGTAAWSALPTASASTAGITKLGASGGAAAYSHTHDISNITGLGSISDLSYATVNNTSVTVASLGGTEIKFGIFYMANADSIGNYTNIYGRDCGGGILLPGDSITLSGGTYSSKSVGISSDRSSASATNASLVIFYV